MTSVLFLLLVVPLPPPPRPPEPPPKARLELIKRLGCECSQTQPGVMQCRKLPAFADNEWTHERSKEFIVEGKRLAAALAELSPHLPGGYSLELQGSADSREIMHVKTWGETNFECRRDHDKKEKISNFDLAFLRACELLRLFPPSLVLRIGMRDPLDYTNPKLRKGPKEAYEGDNYKAVTLFIIFPDRSFCGEPHQTAK